MRINFYTLMRDPLFLILILLFFLFILVSLVYKFFGIKDFKFILESISQRLDAVYLNKGMSFNNIKKKLGIDDSMKFDVNIPLKKSLNIINNEIKNSSLIIGKVSNFIFLIDTNINDLGSGFNLKVGTRIRIPLNNDDFNLFIKSINFFDKIKLKLGLINSNLVFNEDYLVSIDFQETFRLMLNNDDFKESFFNLKQFEFRVKNGIFILFIPNIESTKRKLLESIFSSVSFIKLLYHYNKGDE